MEKKQYNQLISLSSFLFLLMNQGLAQAPAPQPAPVLSKPFVLVHGAGHGAWCWYKVLPLLRSSGYNVTAIDLAASGINPLQITVGDLLQSLPANESIILVGHSIGGFAISYAMERFPSKIACAVFIAALMPGPSLNASTVYQEYAAQQGGTLDSQVESDADNNPTSITLGPIFAKEKLYNLSPVEDWTLATTLIRPEPLPSQQDYLSGELAVTTQNYGTIKRVYIRSDQDLALKIDVQNWMIQKNPPNQSVQIAGSDHMVMISKPNELSSVLQQIAQTY
ncbi:alpha/beta hydrolase, putative [Ricinus communis]|uniref:Alpha/beta hydrolase, putative n=1 Tax=Ricinus communis TaxID=3988 RepID=B9RZI8_RICCO|nr:alpha/beta hydrolase, putative [Ricinus communis]